MKKSLNIYGDLVGYTIGDHISVHLNIYDDEMWYLSIRLLSIHNKPLCEKTCTEPEIARYVNVELHKRLNRINDLIKEVIPFT